VTSIDVVGKGRSGCLTASRISERKLASVVTDSISQQELLGGTSSNAAGALEKV
jgi:hypothetical protein